MPKYLQNTMKKLKIPEAYKKNPPKPILGQILIIYYITKENLGQSGKKNTEPTYGLLFQIW